MSSPTGCLWRGRRWRSSSDDPVTATIDLLTRWEQSGAIWRVRSLSAAEAVVELCTCFGERVDVVRPTDAETLRYLAARPSSADD
jgi:hypothetical protein